MKNSIKKLLLGGAAVLALGVGQDALAQASDTQDLDATAVVLQPVDITNPVNIDFGTFVPDAGATTVVIDSSTGAVNYNLATEVVTGSVGSFDIDADPARVVEITSTTGLLTGGTGADMAFDPVTIEGVDASGGTYNHTQTAAGTPETLRVGGTLAVAGGQGGGTYTDTITITAQYQ